MAIKLLKIDELSDGTQRFQSQLLVGTGTADFILRIDGTMEYYGNGDKGFGFYEYKGQYEIVASKADMKFQQL